MAPSVRSSKRNRDLVIYKKINKKKHLNEWRRRRMQQQLHLSCGCRVTSSGFTGNKLLSFPVDYYLHYVYVYMYV